MEKKIDSPPPMSPIWHVSIKGKQEGPLSLDQISAMISEGTITRASLAWKKGMGDWKPAAEISELEALFTRSGSSTSQDEGPDILVEIGKSVGKHARSAARAAIQASSSAAAAAPKGFLGRLFDFEFKSLITTSVIKSLFKIAVVVNAIVFAILGLIWIGAVFQKSIAFGIVAAMIGIPLAFLLFLLSVIFARIYLEILIVIFRIAEDTRIIARDAEKE